MGRGRGQQSTTIFKVCVRLKFKENHDKIEGKEYEKITKREWERERERERKL